MTIPATLAARAAAQGLHRVTIEGESGWRTEEDWTTIWPCVTGRGFRWRPTQCSVGEAFVYPTEADALTAALHWLDAQYPERALKPSPWAPLANAVQKLRALDSLRLSSRSHGQVRTELHDGVAEVRTLLEGLALSGLSDEERLGLAADTWPPHAVEEGPARRLLVAMLRETPEVVGEARIAMWWPDALYESWSLLAVATSGHRGDQRYADRVGYVWLEDERWRWESYGSPSQEGEATECHEARRACERTLPDWVILTPPAQQPAEAQPEATPAAEGACPTCEGDGIGRPFQAGRPARCRDCNGTGRTP